MLLRLAAVTSIFSVSLFSQAVPRIDMPAQAAPPLTLSPEEIAQLQQEVQNNPDDLTARQTLIAYYGSKKMGPQFVEQLRSHASRLGVRSCRRKR